MTWTMENEPALVKAAQDGDQDAFGTLFDHYFPKVYSRVRSSIPEVDVEDVTQEVFISAARSITKFKRQSSFSTWIYTITRRRVADYYRRSSKILEETELMEDERSPADDNLTRVDQTLLLKQVLGTMSHKEQEILLLRLVEGMKFHEISAALGIELGAAKVRFYRALKICRDMAVTVQM